MASLNIHGGTRGCVKQEQLAHFLSENRTHVLALQEVWLYQQGAGAMWTNPFVKQNYTVFSNCRSIHSGRSAAGQGVALLLQNDFVSSSHVAVVNLRFPDDCFDLVDGRCLCLYVSSLKLILCCLYAPVQTSPDHAAFFHVVNAALSDLISRRNVSHMLVLGDFNAQVAPRRNAAPLPIGAAGQNLMTFASSLNLEFANFGPGTPPVEDVSQHYTRFQSNHAPSILDYILTLSLQSSEFRISHEVDRTDHGLIHCSVSIPPAVSRDCEDWSARAGLSSMSPTKWRMKGWDDPACTADYRRRMQPRLAAWVELHDSVIRTLPALDPAQLQLRLDLLGESLVCLMNSAAVQSIGRIPIAHRNRCTFLKWSPDLERVHAEKIRLFKQHAANPGDADLRQAFQIARNACNRAIKQAKAEWRDQRVREMGRDVSAKDKWTTLKNRVSIKNASNAAKHVPPHMWQEAWGSAPPAAPPRPQQPAAAPVPDEVAALFVREFSMAELLSSMKKLDSDTGRGPDDLCNPHILEGGIALHECVLKLFNLLHSHSMSLSSWADAHILPIAKPSRALDSPAGFRPISLTSNLCKLYERLIAFRLTSHLMATNALNDEQAAFLPGRGTQDHLFSLEQLIQSKSEQGAHTYCCFLDISCAFDKTPRDAIWQGLLDKQVPPKFVESIQALYKNLRSCVLIEGKRTDFFPVSTGVRQGAVLSPLLFDVFVDSLIGQLKQTGVGVRVSHNPDGRRVCVLVFADDIVLLSESPDEMQELLDVCSSWADAHGMTFNLDKSNAVIFGPPPQPGAEPHPMPPWRPRLSGRPMTILQGYKYLGVEFTRSELWTAFVNRVIQKLHHSAYTIRLMGAGDDLSVHTSRMLINALVVPHILYASEVVHYNKTISKKVDSTLSGAFRSAFGAGRKTVLEAAPHDLGLLGTQELADERKLLFYYKLNESADSPHPSLAAAIFAARRATAAPTGGARSLNWVSHSRHLAAKYGLQWQLIEQPNRPDFSAWKKLVKQSIRQTVLDARVLAMTLQKPKAFQCVVFHRSFGLAPYLRPDRLFADRPAFKNASDRLLFQLRSGSHFLNTEQCYRRAGRDRRGDALLTLKKCRLCHHGLDETVEHFLLHCPSLDPARRDTWAMLASFLDPSYRDALYLVRNLQSGQLLSLLLNAGFGIVQVGQPVREALSLYARELVWRLFRLRASLLATQGDGDQGVQGGFQRQGDADEDGGGQGGFELQGEAGEAAGDWAVDFPGLDAVDVLDPEWE